MKITHNIKSCKECPNVLIENVEIFPDGSMIKELCKFTNKSIKEFYNNETIADFCPFKPENKKKKDKIKIDLITGVWKNFCTKENWIKNKRNEKYLKCKNCSTDFTNIDTNPSLVFVTGELNKIVCEKCANKFINEYNKRDLEKERNEFEMNKENIIKQIRDLGNYNESSYYNREKLEDKKIEDLEKIYEVHKEMKNKQDRIDAIIISEEDSKMEDYLIKDYGVIQDTQWLKCEEQIEEFFKDCGSDYLECGNDWYTNEAKLIIKIAKKFYQVTIHAEIGQECGDRTDRYYIEKIDKITWKEIEKPLPKEKIKFTYSFEETEYNKLLLDNFLWEHNIKFKEI